MKCRMSANDQSKEKQYKNNDKMHKNKHNNDN